jgi:hypothetical protein
MAGPGAGGGGDDPHFVPGLRLGAAGVVHGPGELRFRAVDERVGCLAVDA